MTYASLEQTLDPEARNNETWRLAFLKPPGRADRGVAVPTKPWVTFCRPDADPSSRRSSIPKFKICFLARAGGEIASFWGEFVEGWDELPVSFRPIARTSFSFLSSSPRS
jgi:hypothetical protein